MGLRTHYFEAIRSTCAVAWQRQLLSGFNGNVSVRAESDICVTRSGAAKGSLMPRDLTVVDKNGVVLEGEKPSSELSMHLEIYANKPSARAIVHCHPRHLLALEIKIGLDDFLELPLYEADTLRKRLGFAPALAPGSKALAKAVGDAAKKHDAIWMSRHGVTCYAADLTTALALAEELDHLAAVQLLAL